MRKYKSILVYCGVILLFTFGTAFATPILKVVSGNDTVTISDNDPGDCNDLSGAVSWGGRVGDLFLNISTGQTKPVLGSQDYPIMDLLSVNISLGTGSLTLLWTETDFTLSDEIKGFLSEIHGFTTGNVTFETYLDTSNEAFGTGVLLNDFESLGSGFIYGSEIAFVDPDSPFSLTIVATINHSNWLDLTCFDAHVSPTPVPEPATVLLLGIGILAICLCGKKKEYRQMFK